MKIKKKVLAALHEVWMDGSLVQIKRERFDGFAKEGFVIDISAEWLLLHVVNGDVLQFNGYEALRLCDVTRAEKDKTWLTPASKRLGLEPVLQPDVLLVDLPGLLSSVNAHYPVFGIEREKAVLGVMYIGRIDTLRKKSVTIRELDLLANWYSRDIRHRFEDITCVTFGDTYTKLLLQFARVQEAEAASESDNPDVP